MRIGPVALGSCISSQPATKSTAMTAAAAWGT